jgi:hypothetical protein
VLTHREFDRKGHVPTEQSSDVKFEIGHVLFIDIVGYSKLLITEQSKMLEKSEGDGTRDRAVPYRQG